jgi:hypothetical protein
LGLVWAEDGRKDGLHESPKRRRRNTSTTVKFWCRKGGEVGLERFSGWRGSLPGGCSGHGRGDGGSPQRAELAGAEKQERWVRVLGTLGKREEKGNGMGTG